jgi:hypothetical protein
MTQSIFFDVIARDKASSTFSRISKSSSSTESNLKRLSRTGAGVLGALGFAGATAGAVSFFTSSINGASDLNETLSKSRVIFGKHAQQVERWGETTASRIGLSKQAAIEARSSFGDMFSQIGLGGRETLKMSGKVVKLAADLGSFNNLGTDDVLERIAGGFRGEYDALQKVIPNISAARVEQEALNRTHKTSAKDLTAADKAAATLAIIQKDGARAAGDFARTSGGLANQQKILKARTDDLKASVGSGLLPVTTKIVSATSDFVAGMQDGTGAGGDFVDVLHDAAAVGKTALRVLEEIPGPVKKFAVEGLIAYAAIRKLQSATSGFGGSLASPIARIQQFRAEMTYAETRMQRVTTASQAVGAGIRNLAGAGGMLMLAQSTSASNKSTATLMQTLGGAATGFAVGGPIGAAVGGLAGLMLGLSTNTRRAGESAADSSELWKHYAETLDDVTAAQTKATTAAIQETIRSKHLNSTLDDYGFTNRQIVQAIKHQGPLRQRMITDLQAEQKAIAAGYKALAEKHGWSAKETIDYAKSHKARSDAISTTLKELGAVDKAVAKKREDIAATRTFTKALKELPDKVETYVRTNGLKPGIAGVVELARQIKLTPKDIKILLRQNGAEPTDAAVKRVQDRAIALGKLAPVVNVSAKTGQARAELGSFSKYLADVTRPRTVDVTVRRRKSGKAGGIGDLLGQTTGKSGRTAGSSERALGDNMRAAARQTMTVQHALSKFGDALSKTTDEVASLKDLRQSFLDTFQAENLFGADLSEGGGAGALVDFEKKQAQQAAQLLADIQNVAGRGLSKALIDQLRSQGTSGAAQLHAIALGSNDQISQLNNLDAQTTASLQAAGMFAGNKSRGGSIDADLAAAQREEALLNRLVKRLEELQDGKYLVVEIEGEQVVKAIKKRNKRKGVASAGI